MSKLEAESPPEIEVGPMFDMSKPGQTEALQRWMLEKHVSLCAKGGIDCNACKRAAAMGIERPA